ncbi:MAG TPA: MFS transporter [Streptosporangiaceae bacterium]|nr:MFS transporter [Streptosporangiaceae bacterium]
MRPPGGQGDQPPDGLTYSSGHGRWVLLATVLGSAMASIDATVVGIALPAIGKEFDASLADLQWVVTAYTLTLAGLLLFAGALGDKYGRKKIFLIGVIWFAVASLLCSAATDDKVLIGARALQGVGAALLTPGSLAIIEASFRPDDRSKAIGAWSGFAGVGTAIGPFLGGWLIQAVSWRLIFVINLPVAALVVAVALRHVPESRDETATGPVDVTGGVLVTLGLIGLTYGLIDGPSAGWSSPAPLAALGIGVVLLAAFVAWERRAAEPVLPLSLFRSVQFSSANIVTFAVYAALGGALFLLPIQLEQVSGYTPLQAGISLLPVTAIMLALSARSGALAARIGPRLQMSAGPVVIAIGLALFARIGPSGDYAGEVLPAVLVFGFGLAINVAPLTSTVLSAVSSEHAGAASAVNNDVARAASLIAVAVLPAAAGLSGASYTHPAQFSAGFRMAVFISAGLCVGGGILAALTIRNPRRAGRPAEVAPVPTAASAVAEGTEPAAVAEGAGMADGARPADGAWVAEGARVPRSVPAAEPVLHCGLDAPPARCP